jgi:hypothetical protein
VRRRVDAFGIDHSHFTGQRRWSDGQLAAAVAAANNWRDVLDRLGLSDGGGNLTAVRAHATRLGLQTDHLRRQRSRTGSPFAGEPQPRLLRVAGANLAAAWFLLRDHEVLWPLEPCRYDFVVKSGGSFSRIQVKTTTYRLGSTNVASLSNSRRKGRVVYEEDEVDIFFVIDGDLNAYLIPFADVAGFQHISLRAYSAYLVAQRGQWLLSPTARDAA